MFCEEWIVDSAQTRRLALSREILRLSAVGWNEEEIADSVADIFFAWTGRVGEAPDLDVPEMPRDLLTFYAAELFPCVYAHDWGTEQEHLLAEIPTK